jgi:hypothetical protein
MKRWRLLTLVAMALLMVAMSAVPALALSPTEEVRASDTLGVNGAREFARCFVYHYKQIPEAKKLTPRGYQELERTLSDLFGSTRTVPKDPYTAAVMAGAAIGKFIGYDLVWTIGVVQVCWPTLTN